MYVFMCVLCVFACVCVCVCMYVCMYVCIILRQKGSQIINDREIRALLLIFKYKNLSQYNIMAKR